MTFSIHKIILASITLFLTFLTAFVIPAVTTHIATASQPHQEANTQPLEVEGFARVAQHSVVADSKATLTFSRSKVTTKPAGPTPAEIAAKKAAAKKAADAKAAAAKAAAEKKAAVAKAAADKIAAAKAEKAAQAAQVAAYAGTSQITPSSSGAGSTPSAPSANGGDTSVAASKEFARATLAARGMGTAEFQCLNNLWNRESGWNYQADNPTSDAFGIPQSLPGNKMASIAADWATNPKTQILWGIGYISERYGTPCNAWGHSESVGWY